MSPTTQTLQVMGIDPGGTTGWAIGCFTYGAIFGSDQLFPMPSGCVSMTSGQIVGPENMQVDEVMGIIDKFGVTTVIIENFQLRKAIRSEDLLSPVRIGHKIDYAIWNVNASNASAETRIRIGWQMPALAMSSATDERLKIWNIYHKGQEHARDARRHVATFARRAKSDKQLREQFWC